MKVKIIKKKASSLRELGSESVTIKDAETLSELLIEISRYEYMRQNNLQEHVLLKSEIEDLAQMGKVTFGDKYNNNVIAFEKTIETMMQDFADGLFRVFFNERECMELDEKLELKEENEVVLIRLVMLAGRLW